MKVWLATLVWLLLATGCSKTPERAPAEQGSAAKASGAPSVAQQKTADEKRAQPPGAIPKPPRPVHEPPVPCVVRRVEGPVPLGLTLELPLPGGVVSLDEGASVTLDDEFHGARYVVAGPAKVICMAGRLPTFVVIEGVFSLDHGAIGQRAVRVATPASVLTVRGAARVAGRVFADTGVRIELVSGALATAPSARTLSAGQGLTFTDWAAEPADVRVGAATLETRAAALRELAEEGTRDPSDAAALRASVVERTEALETRADPARAPNEAVLDYRRRLADSAKARMKARDALETDMFRWLAAAAPFDADAATLWQRAMDALSQEALAEGAP